MALIIPPQIFEIHSIMNLLYQFWIHTEVIKSFGYLDGVISLIFNTPSAHRVHHGRNKYCIDKNYGGFLIIWDRIFGTYEPERESEKVAYGLVHNVNTFNPIYIQFFHFKYLFDKVIEEKSWSNKLSVLFKGPGWQPGTGRLGDYDAIPPVENPIQRYSPKISTKLLVYTLFHFLFVFYTTGEITKIHKQLDVVTLLIYWTFVIVNLTCISTIFDKKYFALHLESTRCLMWLVYDVYCHDLIFKILLKSNSIAYLVFLVFHAVSVLAMLFALLVHPTHDDEKKKE